VAPVSRKQTRVPPPWWFTREAERILDMIGAWNMPDLGGKKFAADFQSMLKSEIAKAFADGQQIIREATDELTAEIRNQSKGAARAIRAETAAVKEAFSPTTGNNPPEGEELDPTKQKTEGGG
jgi:hypothetical protein